MPASTSKKLETIIADAKRWWAGMIFPPIGLVFLLRLVQWHLWRKSPGFPPPYTSIAKEYQEARTRLWVGSSVALLLIGAVGISYLLSLFK